MPIINYQVNVGNSVSAIETLNSAIRASGVVVGEFTNNTLKLAQSGEIATASINQMATSGQRLTTTFKEVNGQLQLVSVTAKTTAEQVGQAGQSMTVSWQGFVRILEVQVFRRFTSGLITALQQGVQSAIAYQIQLQQVANVTGQSGERLGAFQAQVRGLSEAFGVNIFQTLGAAQIALTGQLGDAAKGFDVLTQSMRLAQATGTDVASATKLMTVALEAFRLQASDSATVANTFFLIAQRSRIPLDQVDTAMGRVSQTAHQLGLNFDQIGALFLTVGQQGGRPTEAFSLLNQVMGRLIQPSQKLQEFLNSLGTPTAALAVQTFGLTGFLQKLSEAAAQTPERLGDLAGTVRSLRGLLALTGDSARIFEQNLRGITGEANALSDAVRRVQATPAQQLRNEFEKIRNVFTQDIGQKFIETVVEISKALGGAQAVTEGFVGAIKTLGLAFVALKLGQLAISLMAVSAQIAAAGSASLLSAGQVSLLAGAFGLLAAAAAGFAIGEALKSIKAMQDAADVQRVMDQIGRATAVTEQANDRIRASTAERVRENSDLVERAFRRQQQIVAEEVRLANEVKNAEVARHREVANLFRAEAQGYVDTLRNRLSQTRENANREKNAQLQSLREVESFRQQVSQQAFQRQIGVEQDPTAAVELIKNRIKALQDEATGIFTNPRASHEEIQRARQIMREIQGLQGEMLNRENEIARQRFEILGEGSVITRLVNGETRQYLSLAENINRANERSNALQRENARLEEIARGHAATREAVERESIAQQQSRIRIAESFLRMLEQFKVFSETDPTKFVLRFQRAEAERPGGGREAALKEFEELAQKLRTMTEQQGGDVGAITALINQRRNAIIAEIEANEALVAAQRRQQEIARTRLETERQLNALTRERSQIIIELGNQAQQAGNMLINATQSLTNIRRPFGPSEIQGFQDTFGRDVAQGARDYNALILAINNAREAQTRFSAEGGRTQANADAFAAAVRRVGEAVQPVLALRGTTTATRLGLQSGLTEDDRGMFSMLDTLQGSLGFGLPRIQRMADDIRNTFGQGTRIEQIDQTIRNITGQLQQAAQQNNAGQIANNLDDVNRAAAAAGQQMERQFRAALAAGIPLDEAVQRIANNLNQIRQGAAPAVVAAAGEQPPNRYFGGIAGYMATGGVLGAFPGRPMGTDTLPYWLTPGEFIMPAAQTRQFFTQLLSMRSGFQPRYAAEGGVVVGDINVVVQGSGPSEKTVREIGRGLDREIRRGTIRLGRKS